MRIHGLFAILGLIFTVAVSIVIGGGGGGGGAVVVLLHVVLVVMMVSLFCMFVCLFLLCLSVCRKMESSSLSDHNDICHDVIGSAVELSVGLTVRWHHAPPLSARLL